MDLTSPVHIKNLMSKYGKRFAKSLGQNFLIDSSVIDTIVGSAGIDEQTGVLEIGPGIGVLTQRLAPIAKKVVAVEVDKSLMPLLTETVGQFENLLVIYRDILKTDIEKLISEEFMGIKVKVAANLPYYITTPILMYLMEKHWLFSGITVMVQKEVAMRMAAGPGTSDYGSLSIALQYYANVRITGHIPPSSFMPPPKVHSCIVQLDILAEPSVKVKKPAMFFRVVKAAFGQRRKTLTNALAGGGVCTKAEAALAIEQLGLREDIRGERLSKEQFALLADCLLNMQSEQLEKLSGKG